MVETHGASVASAAVLRLLAHMGRATVAEVLVVVFWEFLAMFNHRTLQIANRVGRIFVYCEESEDENSDVKCN
jgi:hypothetical protein